MCCLFGILDHNNSLAKWQKNRILRTLSVACEARGTDATGIAYNTDERLTIFKRDLPAHKMRFKVPADTKVIMGHTRMTTQGAAEMNYNNHPFPGRANISFALAHNGVIYNDEEIRLQKELPDTNIKTDSYIAVQLIESQKELSFESLRYMAEQLLGSMTITVLDANDNFYFVKGDNPMCIYYFPKKRVYIYASTEEILKNGLKKSGIRLGKYEKLSINSGDILRINSVGGISRSVFDDSGLYARYYNRYYGGYDDWYMTPTGDISPRLASLDDLERQYYEDLSNYAYDAGFTPEDVKALFDAGYSLDEIAEYMFA